MTNQEYLTLNEVSEHLRISVSTLRKWLAKGHIPSDTYIHVEDTYRFNLSKLVDALQKSEEQS